MKPITVRKILVPVDFSGGSLIALKMASAIAKRHEASLHLLYVTDNDYTLFDSDNSLKPIQFREAIKKLAALAKAAITENNLNCFYTVEYGNITHSILKAAVEMHADLIVMGKNGNNGCPDEYAGTQTYQVSEKSRIPVLIVPNFVTVFEFKKILFPVRPLLSVTAKYDAIKPLILSNRAAVTLLSMRDPDDTDQLHITHRLTAVIQKRLETDNTEFKTEYYFKDGKFADAVLKALAGNKDLFNLAVITSESGTVRDDFHFGYYEKKIIHQSNIPLLLLHSDQPCLKTSEILYKLEEEGTCH